MAKIMEYSVICPLCRTKIVMIVRENPLIVFSCNSCDKNFMVYGGGLYPIRGHFLKEIVDNHRTEECGNILFTRKPGLDEGFITKDKLKDLKDTLDNTFFVDEFLDKLNKS